VQILVVVASTKMKIFWAEVEKGLTWTVIVCELVDPKQFVKYNLKGQWIKKQFWIRRFAKGNQINISEPLIGKKQLKYGDIKKL